MATLSPIRRLLRRRLAAPASDPSQPVHPLSNVRVIHVVGLALILLCWLSGGQVRAMAVDERNDWPTTDGYIPLPPASTARFVSLGYNELAADVAWASTLVYYGSSRINKSDFRYLSQFLDTIIALDPKFYRVYEWAGYAVTFRGSRATQDEFKLSLKYLERGIQEFPDRYVHYWQAALRYWLDLEPRDEAEKLRNRNHAAYLIERAIHCRDAPPRLATLAANMRTRLGQHERAQRTLRQMILTTKDEKARARMKNLFRDLVPENKSAEIEKAQADFQRAWQANLPYVPPDLFVIIGERPDPSIDFEKLATPRDLFGSSDSDFEYLPSTDSDAGVADTTTPIDAGAESTATDAAGH